MDTSKSVNAWIEKFENWKNNKDRESFNGHGSSLKATINTRKILSEIINKYKIKNLIDVGCGDINWIKEVKEIYSIKYTGVDIIPKLILLLNTIYAKSENINFENINILDTSFKKYFKNPDLILIRDLFTLMTYKETLIGLDNILSCNPKYILLTSYDRHNENLKYLQTRSWKPFNFKMKPFNFKAISSFYEKDPNYENTEYNDKCLLLINGKNLKSMVKRRLQKI